MESDRQKSRAEAVAGNAAPGSNRRKVRQALVKPLVTLTIIGGGVAIWGGIQHERHEHQARVHEASEAHYASMLGVFSSVPGTTQGGGPKVESHGCGNDNEYCQLKIEANYETTSIHALASAIDSGFRQLGLNSTKGIFGTDKSLVEAAGKPQFIVEYMMPADATEKIDGTDFYWSASIDCKATQTIQKPIDPLDSLAPQAGVCTAEISWNEVITSDTSGGGFH